ncbi:MAG: hypothetical protein KQA40_03100 [Candidatus Aenigmarchaeota archaeon]|nr:hypothetical protein [Candidatus Aenigmarchaeota archaeon]
MVDILVQVIALISLMIGIFLGESLVIKVFGKLKPKFVLIDIIFFVILITIIYTFFAFTELGLIFYVLNFGIGLLTIIILRAFEAALGFTESTSVHEKISINVIRALARYGLSEDEIKGVLKRSGISPKTVDRLSGIIDESIPAYAPKILKMAADIEEIKKEVSNLKKQISEKNKRK